MLMVLQEQPKHIQNRCKGFSLVQKPSDVLVGGHILYFTRDTPAQFKMGGKVTQSNSVFYEYTRNRRNYAIYVDKYIVLFKPATRRRSKQYRILKSILKALDDDSATLKYA